MKFTYEYLLHIGNIVLNTFYAIIYINIYDTILLLLLLLAVWFIIGNNSFRVKFIYFLGLLLVVSIWGFIYSYDGIILLLLTAELLIILLFLLLYLTINFEITQVLTSKAQFTLYIILGYSVYYFSFFLISHTTIFINITNTYSYIYGIVSSDFFLFFYFFFLIFPHITILIATLLGLFSVYFILFYFNIKYKQQQSKLKIYSYNFIRKQQLIRQSNYNSILINFQK